MPRTGGILSCCPCGIFKLDSESEPIGPSGKYRVTKGDDDVVIKHDDRPRDDDSYIVPLEDDTVRCQNTPREQSSHVIVDEQEFLTRYTSVSDEDGEVDAWQLRDLLNESFPDVQFDGFPLDVCRSMVALSDFNLSGQMSLNETRQLYSQLQTWKEAYQGIDQDQAGYILNDQLTGILQSLGYELDEKTVQAMKARYSDNQDRIYFTDFVACMLKFTAMHEAYQYKQANNTPAFTTDEFIQLTMYS